MAEESHAATGGLFDSLKTLSGSVVGIVHTRLELLSTDIAEERAHLTALLVLGMVSLFCLGVGVVLLAILIVVALVASIVLSACGATAEPQIVTVPVEVTRIVEQEGKQVAERAAHGGIPRRTRRFYQRPGD